jgi:outer membrane immunogenic protein
MPGSVWSGDLEMRVLAAIAVLLVATDVAMAADLPIPMPAVPSVMPPVWAGLYIGIEGGGVFGSTNQIANGPLGFGPITPGYNATGGLAGGTVGYNWQLSNWLLGLEADMSWADVQGSAHETSPFNTSTVISTKQNWLATGRGRVGWIAPNDILLYATGGIAVAGVEADIIPPVATALADTQTRWGGTIGGGLEVKFTPKWSLKAEYLYAKFQSASYFGNPRPGTNTRSDVPLDNNIFRVGVDFAFH